MPRPGRYSNGNPLADDPEAYLEPSVVEGMPLLIGRDPRTITVEQFNALGHEKQAAAAGDPNQLHRVRGR